jgi:type III pantothenate kinase
MLLGVDAGNSMVKYAVFAGSNIVAKFSQPNSAHLVDQAFVETHLRASGITRVTAVAIASVGPHSDALLSALSPLAPNATLRLHAGLELGVPSAYEQPTTLGIDRLLNTIAAHALYGGPAIIADIGTATNFECVGPDGEFLGGAICAGPQLCLDALGARSKHLLHLNFEPPRSLIATNTTDALKSGAYYGHVHLVDGLLRQFQAALPKQSATIVTGGYATQLFPLISSATHLNPDLTLHGVRLAFERVAKLKPQAVAG